MRRIKILSWTGLGENMSAAFYKIHTIDEHTWRIEDLFGDYMYLAEGSEKAALIDTGMGFKGLSSVVSELTKKPVIVLNTHGHLDHVGANGQFDAVFIHPADMALLREHGSRAYREKDIPVFVKEIGAEIDSGVLHDLIDVCQPETLYPIADGDQLELGGRRLEVISVPGHTKGSVCFLDEENRMLFSGDMLCTMGIMLSFDCSTTVSEFIVTMEQLKARTDGRTDAVYGGHHIAPISTAYCDKYIECGRRLLRSSEGAVKEQGTFGSFYRYFYDDISLTYIDKNLK